MSTVRGAAARAAALAVARLLRPPPRTLLPLCFCLLPCTGALHTRRVGEAPRLARTPQSNPRPVLHLPPVRCRYLAPTSSRRRLGDSTADDTTLYIIDAEEQQRAPNAARIAAGKEREKE